MYTFGNPGYRLIIASVTAPFKEFATYTILIAKIRKSALSFDIQNPKPQ